MLHVVLCPFVFILSYDQYWKEGMLKVMKNYQIFSIFICFGLVPQVFEQVDNWFILEFHEMIRAVHVVACPIIFILFYG